MEESWNGMIWSPIRNRAAPATDSVGESPFVAEGVGLHDLVVVVVEVEFGEGLARRGVRPCANLRDPAACPSGSTATIAGIVLLRQRPGTAAGIVFMTIEDETAVANLIVRPEVYERHRAAARHSVYIIARGRVERGAGGVTHLLVREIEALRSPADATPRSRSRNFH